MHNLLIFICIFCCTLAMAAPESEEIKELKIIANSPVHGPLLATRAPQASLSRLTKIAWDKEIVYFILIDRFHDGNPGNNAPSAPNNPFHYHGGDLNGIIAKLPYLAELGITAIWLSPLIDNANKKLAKYWPYHGYHPHNGYAVEEHFGTLADVETLCRLARQYDIKIIIDLVLNHVGYFHPFVQKHNWQRLGFAKWFHPHRHILNFNDRRQVECGWLYGLPDFNQDNPNVYSYLLDYARYWIARTNCAGVRFDAVKHIAPTFWAKFVKDIRSYRGDGFLLLGEVYDGQSEVLQRYSPYFDSMFNYPLFYTIQRVFCQNAPITLLSTQLQHDFRQTTQLWANFIDNHDQSRFGEDAHKIAPAYVPEKLLLALTFIYTIKGMPVLYYGTEQAMTGSKDNDQHRRNMSWDKPNTKIFPQLQTLNRYRRSLSCLAQGRFAELYKDKASYVYLKYDKNNLALVVLHNSEIANRLTISCPFLQAQNQLTGMFAGQKVTVNDRQELVLQLRPYQAEVFYRNDRGLADHELAQFCGENRVIPPGFVSHTFRYRPGKKVNQVYLAGSFNGWSGQKMRYDSEKDCWVQTVILKKGRHQYKFVVEQSVGKKTWVADPNAPCAADDPYGNSILEIK